jgi:hypothetical protein
MILHNSLIDNVCHHCAEHLTESLTTFNLTFRISHFGHQEMRVRVHVRTDCCDQTDGEQGTAPSYLAHPCANIELLPWQAGDLV